MTYRFRGTHTVLSDEQGEILLNKTGQTVVLDTDRANRHIAAGAPLELIEENKETSADVRTVE